MINDNLILQHGSSVCQRNGIVEENIGEIQSSVLPWDDLNGKQILCTGATGFIGRHFVKALSQISLCKKLELNIWLLRRPSATEYLHIPNVHWIKSEIDSEFIPRDLSPDIIVHMASPANPQSYFTQPLGLAKTNIVATQYLLDHAKNDDATFIYFSSGAVNFNQSGYLSEVEASALITRGNPISFYGANKLIGELLCEQYQKLYGVDCRIIRPFSIHGPGESPNNDRFFQSFMRQICADGKIVITGTGKPVRDICYISDFIGGLFYILLKGKSSVYNIGNEENACSILELAQQIVSLNGRGEIVGPLCTTNPVSGDCLIPDTSKLRALGWQPRVDLQTCIKRCLENYRTERFTEEDLS